MNRQKQIKMENDITKAIYETIEKRGYFHPQLDLDDIIREIHLYHPNVSNKYIRKCFYRNVSNNEEFLNRYIY